MGADQVVLVRHGATEWSASGRHTGRTDVPLDDEGRAQAKAIGERLRAWTFSLVLTSPLDRARETCALAGLGDRAQVDGDLAEWDYGDYEGLTTAEIRATRPGWTVFEGGVVNGETADAVGARADRVLARLAGVDGSVALFSHGHFLRILAARWLGLPAVDGRLLALDTATLSVLGYEHETRVVRRWNV
ncbi:MAG TPA: histidine phosphatase family protein [Acidimicrobiia bacterium]|nr:histidine phosphatase family protein [Acidimicrobiia bacterium]